MVTAPNADEAVVGGFEGDEGVGDGGGGGGTSPAVFQMADLPSPSSNPQGNFLHFVFLIGFGFNFSFGLLHGCFAYYFVFLRFVDCELIILGEKK